MVEDDDPELDLGDAEPVLEAGEIYEVRDVCLRCMGDIGDFNDTDNGELHAENMKRHVCPALEKT